MGYWLAEPFWGRGLTTRAVTAICDWAFENYRIVRVFATVFSHNVASIRVLEKSGFTREGTLKRSAVKNGVILDQIMYAKVR
jgi:ribosomal-protein-alanine N-acetyltransferase